MAGAAVPAESARALLADLVATPSPSGEEAACAERLVEFFEAYGREATVDAVGNVRAPADDAVLLTSHVDTVPGDVPVEVRDGELWGRGSVDAKGPLAAMAAAAVRTGVSFAGVVREETDSRGARHLVADRSQPGAVVNGEPGGWDGVTLGYRGILSGTYARATDSAHTSRPEPNAIEAAMDWWARVAPEFEDGADDGDPTGGGGEGATGGEDGNEADDGDAGDALGSVFERVTAKPVGVRGGVADDGLAVEAELDVQFRLPPGTTADEVRAVAERHLDGGAVDWRDEIPPVTVSPRTPVARAFRVAIRRAGGDVRLVRKTGTSDMNLYAAAWDCPMATYGPGDSALDHAPDEHIALDDFDRSVDVLAAVCERLAG